MTTAFDLGAMLGSPNENDENKIQQIPCDMLVPYRIDDKPQCFRQYEPEKLRDLAESIKESGVLNPLIVRPNQNKYMILAGHNRAKAAEKAGLSKVPCRVISCDDRTAQLIMVETNLNQRDKLSYSEKAFAYKIQAQNRTINEISEQNGTDRRQISRYLRLTYLLPQLLDMLDSEKIAFVTAVDLSYLSHVDQALLFNYINDNKVKIKPKQAEELRKYTKINRDILDSIFLKKEIKPKRITFTMEDFSGYFPQEYSAEDIRSEIIKLLERLKNEKE